jgi:general secretion pathway protein L
VRTDIAAAVEQGNFFAARRNAGPTKISVLNELAGVIPDDTWLTRVQVDGTTVRIHGESEGASSLIGLIDQSEIFADPKFSSPVTKNPRTGNDRFVIEATIGIREAPQ